MFPWHEKRQPNVSVLDGSIEDDGDSEMKEIACNAIFHQLRMAILNNDEDAGMQAIKNLCGLCER